MALVKTRTVGRPVEIGDDRLLDAAARALSLRGPAGFTLATAADEAGVSAATYVKRFGSKSELHRRLSRRWVDGLPAELDAAEAGASSPLARVRRVALHNYHDLDRPTMAARQLAALGIDLQDAELSALLHRGWSLTRRRMIRHLRAAVRAGELVPETVPGQLARLVFAAMEGGCLAWSVHPTGSLVAHLRRDLNALLDPWIARGVDNA